MYIFIEYIVSISLVRCGGGVKFMLNKNFNLIVIYDLKYNQH